MHAACPLHLALHAPLGRRHLGKAPGQQTVKHHVCGCRGGPSGEGVQRQEYGAIETSV